jgi:hypothetical protein
MAYHSGLKGWKLEDAPPLAEYKIRDSIAFRHDIMDPYPEIYNECDFIYGEPPWIHGAKVFDKRAGISGRKFTDLTARISELVETLTMPIALTAGAWGLKMLPKADAVVKTSVKGSPLSFCWIFYYRMDALEDKGLGIIDQVVSNYNVVGDWFCGYGNLAMEAYKQNKRFIVSDYVPECIGYIGRTIDEMEKAK